MTEIVPGRLVLGSFEESFDVAGVLQKYGVTHVLNVAEECEVTGGHRVGLEYRKYGMRDDDPTEDITDALARCHAFMRDVLAERDAVVMVHCLEGVSRSACVVAAHLSVVRGLTFDEAMDGLVKRLRLGVDPFPEYARQAREFSATERLRRASGKKSIRVRA